MRKEFFGLLGWAMAWLLGAFLLFARQPNDPLLDQDEIYWIGSAYYYDLAVVQREWRHEAWRLLPARENPPVAKYVIGFGLDVAGHRITTIDNLSYFYLRWLRWEKTPDAQPRNAGEEKRAQVVRAASAEHQEQMRRNPRAPLPRAVVDAARGTVLVCSALGSLGLFLIGAFSGQRLAGLVASLLILLHPVATGAASHAMSDTIALLFSIVAAGILLRWHRRLSAPAASVRQMLPDSLAAGVALALACGAKMNSLVLVLLAGVLTALTMLHDVRRRAPRAAGRAAACGLTVLVAGGVVFAAINPAILADFPGGFAAVVSEHRYTESVQVDLRDPPPAGLAGRAAAVVAMGFFDWRVFLGAALAAVWLAARRWHEPIVRVTICWWVLALAGVIQWLPFAWPRYTLPVLAPTCLLAGLALNAGVQGVIRRWKISSAPGAGAGVRAFVRADADLRPGASSGEA